MMHFPPKALNIFQTKLSFSKHLLYLQKYNQFLQSNLHECQKPLFSPYEQSIDFVFTNSQHTFYYKVWTEKGRPYQLEKRLASKQAWNEENWLVIWETPIVVFDFYDLLCSAAQHRQMFRILHKLQDKKMSKYFRKKVKIHLVIVINQKICFRNKIAIFVRLWYILKTILLWFNQQFPTIIIWIHFHLQKSWWLWTKFRNTNNSFFF